MLVQASLLQARPKNSIVALESQMHEGKVPRKTPVVDAWECPICK